MNETQKKTLATFANLCELIGGFMIAFSVLQMHHVMIVQEGEINVKVKDNIFRERLLVFFAICFLLVAFVCRCFV